MTEPRLLPTDGEFVGVVSDKEMPDAPEPKPDATGFKLQLSLKGKVVGNLGMSATGWCVTVDGPQLWFPGPTIPGSKFYQYTVFDGPYQNWYLSQSSNAQVGVFHSAGLGWYLNNDGTLTSGLNGQNLSVWSLTIGGSIYAWNDYQVLTVQEVY